jgi:hypothetical protein
VALHCSTVSIPDGGLLQTRTDQRLHLGLLRSGALGLSKARHRDSVGQQSGIPTGRADAFPVELVEPEAAVPVGPDMVEPTVVSGAFSDDDTPAEVGFFSRMMLLLTSQHCLGVTP